MIAAIATLGGSFGYDTEVISGALLYIKQDLGLTPVTQAIVVSCLLVGAAFGATFGGKLADVFGRKQAILWVAVVFVVTTLGSALALSAVRLVLARVLLGLAVGCVSATVPLYIGDLGCVAPTGRLVNQNELIIVIGQLAAIINAGLAHLVSGHASWRWMLGLGVVPTVLLLVGMLFLPELPRFEARRWSCFMLRIRHPCSWEAGDFLVLPQRILTVHCGP